MLRSILLFTALVALVMNAAPASRAAEAVWSGLVIAENVAQPEPIPPELTRIERPLKQLFGYNQFQVIGQSSKTLKTGEEDWLAARKTFNFAAPVAITAKQSFTRIIPKMCANKICGTRGDLQITRFGQYLRPTRIGRDHQAVPCCNDFVVEMRSRAFSADRH